MNNGVVLVTGGSGSVGLPLLEALVREGATVVGLARRFGLPRAPAGVRFVCGEIERPDLGLSTEARSELQHHLTSIVHAAALTRFDATLDAARAANVAGTQHLLDFAAGCARLRRLTMLSTVYVAGKRTGTILEPELEHDRGFVNAYEQSKYEAELSAREAMRRLPITIVRLSTIVGAHATGAIRRPAAIHHAMRFLYQSLLPMMPGTDDSPVDLIATDYAVGAIHHLAGDGFEAGRTLHVCAAADAPREAELIDLVVEAFMRYRPAWRRRAIEKPAIVELNTFELFRKSVDAVADDTLRASVAVLAPFAPQLAFPKTFDDRQARAVLHAAGIERPSIRETVTSVVRYLIENGWGEPTGSGVEAS